MNETDSNNRRIEYTYRSSADWAQDQEQQAQEQQVPAGADSLPDEFFRHNTISRDQTQASSFRTEQLAALQQHIPDPFQSKSSITIIQRSGAAGGENHALTDYQMQMMLLEQQNKKRLMLARLEQDRMDQKMDNIAPVAPVKDLDAPADQVAGGAQAGSNSSMNYDHISGLEAEIQRLRELRDSLESTTWLVLHRIQDDGASYLDEPSWTLDKKQKPRLRGNAPLADEYRYLQQRRDVAFVIYKHYEHHHQSRAMETAKIDGFVLLKPEPVRETVHLLSEQMHLAMDAFVRSTPMLKAYFPDWNSQIPIESPFPFWYHCRSEDCVEALSDSQHRSQVRLLTEWIDENYHQVFEEAKTQFALGKISDSTMPFFVRPGEILVTRTDKELRGFVTKTCPKKTGSSVIGNTGDIRQTIRELWAVDTWAYDFNGRFYQRKSSQSIDLEFQEDQPVVDVQTLTTLPLRFCEEEVQAKLRRRGCTMWACRHRKLVTYKEEGDNDMFGVSSTRLLTTPMS